MSQKRRARHLKKRRKRRLPPGTAPGTLQVDSTAPPPRIRVMAYGPDGIAEEELADPGDLPSFLARWPVVWVNVDGLGDAAVIQKLGDQFGLHRLALEDVVNVGQRAKVESYGDIVYIVAGMVSANAEHGIEQLSAFLGRGFVLTFQEREGDCLDAVRDRVRKGSPRIRGSGPDYLAYAILDTVVDHYFPLLESYGERLDVIQEEIAERPSRDSLSHIHAIRSDLTAIRRVLWPLRDAVNVLLRDPLPHVSDETRLYLRDCYDHVVSLIDLLQTDRESAAGLMEFHMSSVGNRMNEVMKVLTVFAALFIPLTFVAGLYGMNFNPERSPWNMPELNWYWGYPFAWLLMAVIAAGMLVFFWRKGFFR
jgi:magnesium transporter